MASPVYRTAVTDIYDIDHPILAGGLNWLSKSQYVSAVVNAGGMAFITPRSYDNPADLKEDLGRCRELTSGRPFGVNLSISSQRKNNEQLRWHIDLAFGAGVRFFETVGNTKPTVLIKELRDRGGIVLHKCSSIRHALSAQAAGADLVGIVGHEEGGHPGNNDLSTLTLTTAAARKIHKPLVVGGGIGTGQQIVAMLAVGAAGVVMGSRFLACHESWAHDAYKHHISELDENCSVAVLSKSEISGTWRVLRNETTSEVQRLEAAGATRYEDFADLISGQITRDVVYKTGDCRRGMISVGPAAGFSDRVEPVQDIIDQLIFEAREAEARLQSLHASTRSEPRASGFTLPGKTSRNTKGDVHGT